MYTAHTKRQLNPECGLGDEIHRRGGERVFTCTKTAAFKKHRPNTGLYQLRSLFIIEKAGRIIMCGNFESQEEWKGCSLFQGTIPVFAWNDYRKEAKLKSKQTLSRIGYLPNMSDAENIFSVSK